MGKSQLNKRIDKIMTGIFIFSCVIAFILLNSNAIDGDIKNQILLFFFAEIGVLFITYSAVHWKDNKDLEEILSIDRPMDSNLLEAARKNASKGNVVEAVIFGLILVFFAGLAYSIMYKDQTSMISLVYYFAPISMVPLTFRLYNDLEMNRLKMQLIPMELHKIMPDSKKKLIRIAYVRGILTLGYMVIRGYDLSLSIWDDRGWILALEGITLICILICLIWEWSVRHPNSKKAEAN